MGVSGVSGVYWETVRECRYLGARRGIGSIRALGSPRGVGGIRGHQGHHMGRGCLGGWQGV